MKLKHLISACVAALQFLFPALSQARHRDRGPETISIKGTGSIRVACVGDSITAGAGSSGGNHTYPSILSEMLGSHFRVGNFGESGSTLLKNGDSPFWQRGGFGASQAFKPDVVVLMLGTNDSKSQNWVHAANFEADYEALLDTYASLANHPQLFVCLPPPVLGADPPYGIREAPIQQQIPMIRRAAEKKGAKVIDVHDEMGQDPSDFADGIHPDDQGYLKLAGIIYSGLTEAPIVLPMDRSDFYQTLDISLQPTVANSTVRYTLDGSTPTAASPAYTAPIAISQTTTVTAQTFVRNSPMGLPASRTFTALVLTPPAAAVATTPGLSYRYFEGAFASTGDLMGLTPTATGTVSNFSLSAHRQDTGFGFIFDGYVTVSQSGLYTFATTSDDGSVLLIDGVKVVDNDGLHGDDTVTGQIALEPGNHAVELRYIQGTGGFDLAAAWSGPGIDLQPIPDAVLSHGP